MAQREAASLSAIFRRSACSWLAKSRWRGVALKAGVAAGGARRRRRGVAASKSWPSGCGRNENMKTAKKSISEKLY